MAVIDESVDRQELDRSDAERFYVIDYLFVGQSLVGSAMRFRYRGMQLGEAAHMRLIKDRVIPGHRATLLLLSPIEVGIDDNAFGHERRAVTLVEARIVARLHLIAENRRVPLQLAEMPFGVRI